MVTGLVESSAFPAAEDVAFCRVGRRLRRLSALNQEDVDREVHPKSGCPLPPGEHAERPGYNRRYKVVQVQS